MSLIVTPGQRADCTQFKPVLERIRVPKPGPGRPRKKPDSVTADTAYSNGPCRQYLRRRGIRYTTPEKADSPARPPAQRLTRRPATGLRRRAVQEAQHHRTGHQPAEAVQGRRHEVRQAWLRVPWRSQGSSLSHLAPCLMDWAICVVVSCLTADKTHNGERCRPDHRRG
ncbi:transposase [Streptomyces xanthophaeus]|uniref:transposase n=1 Tax=Streptomyces xanthophaeus TaxID=67385 RepID=UPI003646A46E